MSRKIHKGRSGTYYIIWSDSRRSQRKQVRESLKTKDWDEAEYRKSELEHRFFNGNHNPWNAKWYEKNLHFDVDKNLQKLVEEHIHDKKTDKFSTGWGEERSKRIPSLLRHFVRHVGASKSIDQVSKKDIQSFLFRDSINSGRTRKDYLTTLRTFWNWAVDNGYTDNRLTYRLKPYQKKIPTYYSSRDISRIVRHHAQETLDSIQNGGSYKHLSSLWYCYAWLLMISTGLRPKELLQLKQDHVDMDNQVIVVGQDFTTKTHRMRTIPFFRYANMVLDKLMNPTQRAKDQYMKKSDYLFGRSSQQTRNRLNKRFKEAVQEVVPDKQEGSLYNLRHSFALYYLKTQSRQTGRDYVLLDLKRIMGHSKLSTTERYLDVIRFHSHS